MTVAPTDNSFPNKATILSIDVRENPTLYLGHALEAVSLGCGKCVGKSERSECARRQVLPAPQQSLPLGHTSTHPHLGREDLLNGRRNLLTDGTPHRGL